MYDDLLPDDPVLRSDTVCASPDATYLNFDQNSITAAYIRNLFDEPRIDVAPEGDTQLGSLAFEFGQAVHISAKDCSHGSALDRESLGGELFPPLDWTRCDQNVVVVFHVCHDRERLNHDGSTCHF